MKFSEAIERIKKLKLKAYKYGSKELYVYSGTNVVGYVHLTEYGIISTNKFTFIKLDKCTRRKLLQILTGLAFTEVENREEEKLQGW